MKTNLDLNAYGVEEMSVAEMRENEGGIWQGILLYFLIQGIIDEVNNPGSFMTGYEAVRNK
jgi:hypothetical protein